MADRDIVDDIDALVDEQLQQERSGYDHNVNQELCPHCGRHWHGLPLTAEVAMMYAAGIYDPTYSVDSDDSPVVCPGSTFIGPLPPDDVSAVRVGDDFIARRVGDEWVWDHAAPTRRGYELDLVLFDEAATPRPKRILAAMVGWGLLWAAGILAAFHLPGSWFLLGYPVQGWALWKLIRTGRVRRAKPVGNRRPTNNGCDCFLCTDSEGLGPDWRRYYNGFGFSSGQGNSSGPAALAEWRTDDGT